MHMIVVAADDELGEHFRDIAGSFGYQIKEDLENLRDFLREEKVLVVVGGDPDLSRSAQLLNNFRDVEYETVNSEDGSEPTKVYGFARISFLGVPSAPVNGFFNTLWQLADVTDITATGLDPEKAKAWFMDQAYKQGLASPATA